MNTIRYAVAFAMGLGLTFAVTPLFARLAARVNAVDHPDERKVHVSPIPYLGGLAIIGGFSLAVATGTAFLKFGQIRQQELLVILGCAVALGLVGLADDLWQLPAAPRLLLEVVFGAVVWWAGVGVSLFSASAFDAAITVLWIVGVTNAFNLLDNVDGLSAGVAAIGALVFFVAGAANGQFLVASLAIALSGCALGFLWHNFHPAKIFMGDAGALFLGFMLAVIGIKLEFQSNVKAATLWVPVLVLSIAVFDTTLVVIDRLRHRRPVFKAAQDHVSHRLMRLGLTVRQSVLVIYLAAACAGYLGYAVSLSTPVVAWMIISMLAALATLAGFLLLKVPAGKASTET